MHFSGDSSDGFDFCEDAIQRQLEEDIVWSLRRQIREPASPPLSIADRIRNLLEHFERKCLDEDVRNHMRVIAAKVRTEIAELGLDREGGEVHVAKTIEGLLRENPRIIRREVRRTRDAIRKRGKIEGLIFAQELAVASSIGQTREIEQRRDPPADILLDARQELTAKLREAESHPQGFNDVLEKGYFYFRKVRHWSNGPLTQRDIDCLLVYMHTYAKLEAHHKEEPYHGRAEKNLLHDVRNTHSTGLLQKLWNVRENVHSWNKAAATQLARQHAIARYGTRDQE